MCNCAGAPRQQLPCWTAAVAGHGVHPTAGRSCCVVRRQSRRARDAMPRLNRWNAGRPPCRKLCGRTPLSRKRRAWEGINHIFFHSMPGAAVPTVSRPGVPASPVSLPKREDFSQSIFLGILKISDGIDSTGYSGGMACAAGCVRLWMPQRVRGRQPVSAPEGGEGGRLCQGGWSKRAAHPRVEKELLSVLPVAGGGGGGGRALRLHRALQRLQQLQGARLPAGPCAPRSRPLAVASRRVTSAESTRGHVGSHRGGEPQNRALAVAWGPIAEGNLRAENSRSRGVASGRGTTEQSTEPLWLAV